jgi:signal transduction histidine kinase
MKKTESDPKKATDLNKLKTGNIPGQRDFLESVLESLTHPFYVVDARDYTIRMANSAARLGDMKGAVTCHALTHRKDRPCGSKDHPCPLEMVKETGKPVTVEHVHYDKDGNIRNVEVHGFPIFDSDGNIIQMIEYCLDITDRKRVEKALQLETKANEQLLKEIERRKLLEKELLSIVERERQRIGRELHDSIGQQLTAIAFMMEVLGEKLGVKSSAEELQYAEKIHSCVDQAAEQTRNLAKGLVPVDLDGDGLTSAIQELASKTEQLFGVSCAFHCDSALSVSDVSAAMNLYRIAQEAITNAVRHGNTSNITISLIAGPGAYDRQSGPLTLTVENDGLDFPAETDRADGMGLKIMRYRAEAINSSLEIRKRANGGTVVTCELPNGT